MCKGMARLVNKYLFRLNWHGLWILKRYRWRSFMKSLQTYIRIHVSICYNSLGRCIVKIHASWQWNSPPKTCFRQLRLTVSGAPRCQCKIACCRCVSVENDTKFSTRKVPMYNFHKTLQMRYLEQAWNLDLYENQVHLSENTYSGRYEFVKSRVRVKVLYLIARSVRCI